MITAQPIRRSHYRLLGLVGHGQFGRVYCAVHRKSGKLVAIKDLHRDRFTTHKFLRELRFLISLEHPNIAACHALEHSSTGRQIVLDYCEGGTLRTIIDSDIPPTLQESLTFVLDILAGLDYAHQQGIVHCDIKPENVLLTLTPKGWTTKITDFGIARLSQEGSVLDMGNSGSPAYMAPERFYNQHSAASDVYAVGVILFELLTGHRPFVGTPAELMVAHLNRIPQIPEAVPPPLAEILRKSLQKLVPRRFQQAGEMHAALQQVYAALETGQQASTTIRAPQLPKPCQPDSLPTLQVPHPVSVLGLVPLAPGAPTRPTEGSSQSPIDHLLIACHEQQVWFYSWPSQTQAIVGPARGFALPSPVQKFTTIPQGGCFFTTQSVHLLSMMHGLGTVAQYDHPILGTVAARGGWFAVCFPRQNGRGYEVHLYQLQISPGNTTKIVPRRPCRVPTQAEECVDLLALDQRHLLLHTHHNNETEFHLITRRGQYLGQFGLKRRLQQLVPTDRPYRYLALEAEAERALLVVDFKPLRVVRHRLPIVPSRLFCTAAGYGAINNTGDMVLLGTEGEILGLVRKLPAPTALAQVSPTQWLVGSRRGEGANITTLDLKELGLDILF